MKKLIFIAAMTLSMTASAMTDYVCVNQCRDAGMSYGYCLKVCEY